MDEHRYIQGALIFLLAVVVAVPLFERLKFGAVLAYLVAGAVLGPHGAGLMRFDDEGLVVEARDYWNMEPGRRDPPPGWGA